MDNKTKIYTCLVWLLMLGAVTTSCSKDDEGGSDSPCEERYTGDAYKDLHSPWVENPSLMIHFTRWDCILFGSYPANEVVTAPSIRSPTRQVYIFVLLSIAYWMISVE